MEKLLELFETEPFFATEAIKTVIAKSFGENVGEI